MAKIKEGFKRAHYRWIPCYFNENTSEIVGRNWFYDQLIEFNIWFDYVILGLEELPIWVDCTKEEIDAYNKKK